jgi:alkanesulfonate monooxygenase SsuD/methylene tetrahydromethanopterin reductase-like flavin-dependent oxidoreductase (luciferase family)
LRAGLTIHSGDHPLSDILSYVQEAEKLDYDGFWLTEESGKEAFSLLALSADRTKKIRVGTGIVNIYSRTPTLLAMAIATIDNISKGRAFLGLGTGGIGFIERGHGLKIEDPLGRMKEYVTLIKRLLSGERFSYGGKYFNLKDFKLREEPARKSVPIYLAGLNKKMQQLAGEVADGVIVNMLTDEGIKEITENLKIGAERADRDKSSAGIYALSMTLCGDTDDAMEAMKKVVAFYCASPHYHHIIQSVGYGDVAKQIEALWNKNQHSEALKLVSDDLVQKVTLSGSPKEVQNRINRYITAGVYPIVYPIIRKESARDDVLYAMRAAVGNPKVGDS